MEIIFLIVGVVLGGIIGFLIGKKSTDNEPKNDLEELKIENTKLSTQLASTQSNIERSIQELTDYKVKYEALIGNNHALQATNKTLEEKLSSQKHEIEQLQEKFKIEFENIANKILKQNTADFSKSNEKQIGDILSPLKEKIENFQKKVEETNNQTQVSNAALNQQIKNLKELNEQMSKEAVNLTKALKGDSKTQGNWGEVQLEQILLHAGLEKDIHYSKEEVMKTDEGQILRPDYIIHLPDNKNLIIDSKVSLTAYNNYFNEENETKKQQFIKDHLLSINNHIKQLSEKHYQNLNQIEQPDYILMFLANEPALTLALKNDSSLFEKALEKNIVLVSTSTLLATLRTISYIWKTDSQNKNAHEIAERAGKLYEQFKRFSDDLIKIGVKLNESKGSYDDAMKRLSEGKGNIVGQIEKLKKLGANTTQSINPALANRATDDDDNLLDE